MKECKAAFDRICNYKKRRNSENSENENAGSIYDLNLHRYLMIKTFKKSAIDAYDSFLRIPDEVETLLGRKECLNVCCLGGGPGSDLTGVLTYMIDNEVCKDFECKILDFNSRGWSEASLKTLRSAYDKNLGKRATIKVDYGFLDYNEVQSIDQHE